MVAFHVSFRYFRNVNPLLARSLNFPFGFGSATIKQVHSLSKFKQKRPAWRINRSVKKPLKLPLRENVEPKIYTRDTIAKISNILRYSTWDSSQEQLENLEIRWDSYIINQVLKTHPPMQKAWLFFNWTSRLRGFKHDQFTYTTMLDIFGEAGRISSMKYVFRQMQEKEIKIDAVTYTSLLHWLSHDGDIDGAVKLWEEMNDKGCSPTVVSYTAYMKVLFDHNRVKEATKIYKEMIDSGFRPTCHTYTVLMEHLAGSGKFDEVLQIFGKMQEAEVLPDKAACNILVGKCCEAGETWAMTKIVQYMKENSLVLRKPVYMKALKTYRIAGESDALLRQANRHISIQCNDEGLRNDFSAAAGINSIEQGLVINFLTRRNFVAVDCLLADMMEKNIKLDSDIITTVIEVYSANSRLEGALLAFEYSVKMGLTIERTGYLSLIGLLVRMNSFSKTVEVVEEMVSAGISLGTHQGALLIYRLGCARKPASAAKVFDLLPENERSTTAYTALIAAYFASTNAAKGLQMFKAMKDEGIPIALGTYNVLLAGLERSGRVVELESYRKEKKRLQAARRSEHCVPMEEMTCNLLFAKDVTS